MRRDTREQMGDHSWPTNTAGRANPMAGVNGIPHDGNEVAKIEDENAECGCQGKKPVDHAFCVKFVRSDADCQSHHGKADGVQKWRIRVGQCPCRYGVCSERYTQYPVLYEDP